MKTKLLSVMALIGLFASQASASIISCQSANLFYASGTAHHGFSLQTRSGHFLQSSYHYLDGDLNIEFFFLDFHEDLLAPFDWYSHDLIGMISDYGVPFYPGESTDFDYEASIAGVEQFGLDGVVTDYFTSFSVNMHFIYDGEEWSGSGTWEYYTLPFDDLIACENPVPEQNTVPDSGPGTILLAGMLAIGLAANGRRSSVSRKTRKHGGFMRRHVPLAS